MKMWLDCTCELDRKLEAILLLTVNRITCQQIDASSSGLAPYAMPYFGRGTQSSSCKTQIDGILEPTDVA